MSTYPAQSPTFHHLSLNPKDLLEVHYLVSNFFFFFKHTHRVIFLPLTKSLTNFYSSKYSSFRLCCSKYGNCLNTHQYLSLCFSCTVAYRIGFWITSTFSQWIISSLKTFTCVSPVLNMIDMKIMCQREKGKEKEGEEGEKEKSRGRRAKGAREEKSKDFFFFSV